MLRVCIERFMIGGVVAYRQDWIDIWSSRDKLHRLIQLSSHECVPKDPYDMI